MLRIKRVINSYSANDKENKKRLNSINMILKLCRLIQANNCCNLN